jgi:hypothetical protein
VALFLYGDGKPSNPKALYLHGDGKRSNPEALYLKGDGKSPIQAPLSSSSKLLSTSGLEVPDLDLDLDLDSDPDLDPYPPQLSASTTNASDSLPIAAVARSVAACTDSPSRTSARTSK